MFGILVLLFTVIPALEIYLLLTIGSQLGAMNTFAIVIITGIVGAGLAKSQGLAILAKIQNELNQGQIPASQIVHGLLVFGGGLLLLTPGFLTDILGLSMVFPGTRHIIAALLKDKFSKMIASGNVKFYSSGNFSSYTSNQYQEPQDPNQPRQVDENTFEADFEKKD